MVVSEATTDTTEGVTASERSTSVTVSVPLVLSGCVALSKRLRGAVDADNADHRRILAAGDGDGHRLRDCCRRSAVGGLDRVGQRQRLARRQVVEGFRSSTLNDQFERCWYRPGWPRSSRAPSPTALCLERCVVGAKAGGRVGGHTPTPRERRRHRRRTLDRRPSAVSVPLVLRAACCSQQASSWSLLVADNADHRRSPRCR